MGSHRGQSTPEPRIRHGISAIPSRIPHCSRNRPRIQKNIPLIAALACTLFITPAPAAESDLELAVSGLRLAREGRGREAAVLLESLYPPAGKSVEFRARLAQGFAEAGLSGRSAELLQSLVKGNEDLPLDTAGRLVETALALEQHDLARSLAAAATGATPAQERALEERIEADLAAGRSGFSYFDLITRLKATAAFDDLAGEPRPVWFDVPAGRIRGLHLRPKGNGPFPALLHIPGGAEPDEPPPPRLYTPEDFREALAFVREGFHFVFLEPRGFNGNEGIYVSDEQAAADLTQAAEAVAGWETVDASCLLALGSGSGGAIVLRAAAKPSPLAGVVAVDPPPGPPGGLSAPAMLLRSHSLELILQAVEQPALVVWSPGKRTEDLEPPEAAPVRFLDMERELEPGRPMEGLVDRIRQFAGSAASRPKEEGDSPNPVPG